MRDEALARALARRLVTGACVGLLLACAPADRAEPDATGGVDTEPNATAGVDAAQNLVVPGGRFAPIEPDASALERLAVLNGAPITFTGFGWDRGGTVTGYGGGALSSYRDGTGFFLLLDASPRVTDDALIGDHDVSSDDPALAGYDVRVRGLEAQWRTPRSRDCA